MVRREDNCAKEGGNAIGVPPLELRREVHGVREESGGRGDDVDSHDATESQCEKALPMQLATDTGEVLEQEKDGGGQRQA